MKLVIAADPFAAELKTALVEHLAGRRIDVLTVAGDDNMPYYESGAIAAKMVQQHEADGAILLCGTGAGMSIVANKFAGITAVCVESAFAAGRAKAINRANVLTLGAMIVGKTMACAMADAWIDTKYNEGLEDLSEFLDTAAEAVNGIDAANRR